MKVNVSKLEVGLRVLVSLIIGLTLSGWSGAQAAASAETPTQTTTPSFFLVPANYQPCDIDKPTGAWLGWCTFGSPIRANDLLVGVVVSASAYPDNLIGVVDLNSATQYGSSVFRDGFGFIALETTTCIEASPQYGPNWNACDALGYPTIREVPDFCSSGSVYSHPRECPLTDPHSLGFSLYYPSRGHVHLYDVWLILYGIAPTPTPTSTPTPSATPIPSLTPTPTETATP